MKKLIIALMGGTVLLLGLLLLVLPGPGLPIIAAGLAMLAAEFQWAKRLWHKSQGLITKVRKGFGIDARLRGWRTVVRGKERAMPSEPSLT